MNLAELLYCFAVVGFVAFQMGRAVERVYGPPKNGAER